MVQGLPRALLRLMEWPALKGLMVLPGGVDRPAATSARQPSQVGWRVSPSSRGTA